jgi:xanthine dehydrogenase YagR molybdenum-binding subunit
MYTSTGHRPPMVQQLKLGATKDGKLTAIAHDTIGETWQFETYAEPTGAISRMMYACPNFSMTHRVVKVNAPKANMMHVPGEGIGSFALESAMDEMAYTLNLDPIELRLRNYADVDPTDNRPWSSKHLKECYQAGAEAFGWARRTPKPRSMSKDGH